MKHAWCILLVGLLACEKKPSEPGSCQRGPENVCIEYDATTAGAGKHLCAGLTWTPGAHSCPVPGRVGLCTKKPLTGEEVQEIVYAGPPNNYATASAKAACEHAAGTFKDVTY